MKKLNVGLAGLGRAGWKHHAPHIGDHPGLVFTAAADPMPERRAEAEQKFKVRTYADYSEMLAKEKLDLVVIASPTHLHKEQAIAAFEKNIDVFCDKPLAPTLADVDELIAAMKRTNRKLMVFQPHRVGSDVQTARKIIESGVLGPIFVYQRSLSNYVRRNDWQAQRKYGGGMVNNYGAHMVDQFTYLFGGQKVITIDCHLRRVATLGDAEDVFKAFLQLENGLLVDIDINNATAIPVQPWLICGKYGAASLNEKGDGFRVRYFRPEEAPDAELQQGVAAANRSYDSAPALPWREEEHSFKDLPAISFYKACYEFYAEGKPPLVPIEQTREVMRILEECRKAPMIAF